MILKYVASSGDVYDLNAKNEILTREANYHSWAWIANGTDLQFGKRVANFSKEAAEYPVTLTFEGSRERRKNLIEALHEEFEADIRNKTPGRVIWGDYYIDCFIIESSTTPDERLAWTDNEVLLYCPYPFWIREETRSFAIQNEERDEDFLDYEFDYSYDYSYQPGFTEWERDFPFASEFKMVIHGPAQDPLIMINGYPYKIYDQIGSTDYIVIDSRNNSVTKVTGSGQTLNIFDLRDKTQSVFAPIPGGDLAVSWPGTFEFDLTLYEERSEPRWSTS